MKIYTFLTSYWIYVTAIVLAVWNVYLHFKASRAERKKNLQTAYFQLTGVINDFQVECLKHFHLAPEIMNLKLTIAEDVNSGIKVLKNVVQVKKKELSEKKDDIVNSLAKLKNEYEQTSDDSIRDSLRQDIKLEIAAVNLLIEDFKDEMSKNAPFLEKASDLQKLAEQKLNSFQERIPLRVISLSEAAINLTQKINAASGWQLTASKTVIKLIDELKSSASNLNLKILKSVSGDGAKVDIETIVKSEEFRIIWELAQKVITKMRAELS